MSSNSSRLLRDVARALTLVALLVVFVAVPVLLLRLFDDTSPIATWRAVWRRHRLSPDAVVEAGLVCFLVMWAWFALTALSEARRVWPRRHEVPSGMAAQRAGGPSGWIRGAVRFIAVGSVSAAVLATGMGGVHAAAPVASAHVVEAGDSYWSIADAALDASLGRDAHPDEVWALTQELVARNAPRLGHRDPTLLVPGETVVLPAAAPVAVASVTAPAPTPAAVVVLPTDSVPSTTVSTTPAQVGDAPSITVGIQAAVPPAAPAVLVPPSGEASASSVVAAASVAPEGVPVVPAGDGTSTTEMMLVAAGMLAAGVVVTASRRRGRALRSSPSGSRLEPPTFAAARLELQLRALDPAERLARLDVALRAAAPALGQQGSSVLAACLDAHGEVRLLLSAPAHPDQGMWTTDLLHESWRLPAAVPLTDVVAGGAATGSFPCPALVQVGVTDDATDVYVDLEAMGVLAVESPRAGAIARTIASSLAWSPWLEGGDVIADLELAGPGQDVTSIGDPSELWWRVTERQAAVARVSPGSTVVARVDGRGDACAPLVAITAAPRPVGDPSVSAGSGVGVVLLGPTSSPFCLRGDDERHVLEPFGISLRPSVVDNSSLRTAAEIVEHAGLLPLAVVPDGMPAHVAVVTSDVADIAERSPCLEPRWDVLVTLLGHVTVQDRAGRDASFEKAKSMELLVWLTQHRERPTRGAARSALWDVAVRDSTFANVVSDCRRSLARLVPPPHGEEWVGRTMSDDLPLHPRVVTDADLLAGRVAAARGLPAEEAIAVLRPGVELLHGMPFGGAGAGYLWVDGEGHTSSLVLLATGAAEQLATHHLALGDIDGVFWATGKGLSVLPAHESLIGLRMRAHAMRGDTAGVRLEWERYERALAADAWSDDEPSPTLAALRRELLSVSAPR